MSRNCKQREGCGSPQRTEDNTMTTDRIYLTVLVLIALVSLLVVARIETRLIRVEQAVRAAE